MNLETNLSLRPEQRLALLPKMLQSIEVLQMAAVDLLQFVEQEIEQNETLELLEDPVEQDLPETVPDRQSEEEIFEPRPTARSEDGKHAFLNNIPDQGGSLLEFIGLQLAWSGVAPDLYKAVRVLAQHLDERGLLLLTDEELSELLPETLLDEAIELLQSFEPRGIGARDSVEAMLMQLAPEDPDISDIAAMLREHLPALARNKIPDVAKALGRTPAQVEDLMERIRRLNPRPGEEFIRDDNPVVRPDALVEMDQVGNIQVAVDDRAVPSLGLNSDYAAMISDRSTAADVRRYLRGKLHSAKALIDAVEQRQHTLGRVVTAVMVHQRRFIESGRAAICTLKMADIADDLGLHTSTVSRAIAGKYVQTPHGIFRLRDFFDGGRGNGQGKGRLGVKQRLSDLIADEDPERPLSDDDLVGLLTKEGIGVARRTITKYRKELAIPSSWMRRKYGGSR